MRFMRKSVLLLCMLILIISAFAVKAATSQLNEGDEAAFNVGGIDYNIRADFVGSASAKFSHNQEYSATLHLAESYVFSDGLRLQLDKIITVENGLIPRKAEFTLSITPVCGDGTCSTSETCQADNCCNGALKSFNNDVNNCGNCNQVCQSNQVCTTGICTSSSAGSDYSCSNNVCDSSETCGSCSEDCKCGESKRCENNACVTFCGNKVCESSENYGTCQLDCKKQTICGDDVCEDKETNCCKDCGCEKGYYCSENKCIQSGACSLSSDCDDKNPCTMDICSGSPKVCLNEINLTCLNKLNKTINLPVKTKANETPKGSEVTKESPKVEKKVNFFSRFFGWLSFLFR